MALLTNDIYVGSVNSPLYHFTNADAELGGFKGNFGLDVIGNELTIDQFTVTVRWTEDDYYEGLEDSNGNDLYTANDERLLALLIEGVAPQLKSFMQELPFGTPVWWYVDDSFYAKGYLKSVDRISKNGFKLTCVSGVGLLDSGMHPGGLYQGTYMLTVLQSIIGSAFSWNMHPALQTLPIYGRLPYDTRRNNLHRLLFATGAALRKNSASIDYAILYLSDTVTEVPTSRVALQGSVQHQLPSNKVEVTEHSFFFLPSAATETLFDNTNEAAADHLTVIFDAPVFVGDSTYPTSLATTGSLVVNESGVNYAVVSGVGTLTGKYYTHTTQIMEMANNPNNDPVRVRRVENNELITAVNSRNVAKRVLSYYQSAKTVKAKILLDGEKCGDYLQFWDAFGELTAAYLSRMDTLVTSVIGAQCQLIEGFIPSTPGNNFTHRQAITASGTWTVPDGVTFVRIVLIGGGQGGQGGYDGGNGAGGNGAGGLQYTEVQVLVPQDPYPPRVEYGRMYYYNSQPAAGVGGNAGGAGVAGKVYIIERSVTPGEVLTFNIGQGGQGGARNGGSGSSGSASTVSSASIGSESSESGVVGIGYYDPFTGDAYALAGAVGITGGDGGQTNADSLAAWNGYNGRNGAGAGNYAGGVGGAGIRKAADNSYGLKYSASGGGGGGAAYGANGGAGGAGSYEPRHYEEPYLYPSVTRGGNGGKGADASAPAKPAYGCAGNGGNGGGGGGNGGGCFSWPDYVGSVVAGAAGLGGNGSVGGAGGDGLGLVYF